jgi:hypothetical protein
MAQSTIQEVWYCDGFAQNIKLWSQEDPFLGKHVETDTWPTIQERCFLCGSRRDHYYAAASAPRDWLVSDHVEPPTDTNTTKTKPCFLCVDSTEKI